MIDGQSAGWIAPMGIPSPVNRPGMIWSVLLALAHLVGKCMAFVMMCSPRLQDHFTRVIGLNVALLQPSSVGSVMITSRDINTAPAVDPNFLSTEKDLKAMLHGVASVKKLVA